MKILFLTLLLISSAAAMPFPRPQPKLPQTDDQTVVYLENLRTKTESERATNRRAAQILSEFTGRPMDPFFAFWIDEETHAIDAINDTISLIQFGHIQWKQ